MSSPFSNSYHSQPINRLHNIQPNLMGPTISPHNVSRHLQLSNYGNSNNSNANSHSVHWNPNISTAKSSQIYVNANVEHDSNLSKQFTKQIEIKNSMNQLNPAATDNFKKTTNKVQFQSASHDYPTQAQTLAYNSASGNPSISMVIKPTQLQVGQDQLYQSYKNNTSVSQSYETPKFNYYPSPYSSIDKKNSVSNFNRQMQASVPNSLSAPTPPYFNILLPNPSPDSPTKSVSSSPILTKSIISPEPPAGIGYMQPKVSAEENTQAFSNNQSLRETKFNS